MGIWKNEPTLEQINQHQKNSMAGYIGIEFVEVGPDFMRARMPVNAHTHQPYGILHGGASVALAETLGSVASTMCLNAETHQCVGLEINANHVRPARSGWVYATARPVHIGARTHVWNIEIKNELGKNVCVSRLTMAVIARESLAK